MDDLLRQLATNYEKPLPSTPAWVRIIALNREVFFGTAVYQANDEGGEIPSQARMPLIALQNPYVVVWLPLDRVPFSWTAHLGMTGLFERAQNMLPKFSVGKLQFSSHPTVFSEDGGELWVLEELVFCGGSSVIDLALQFVSAPSLGTWSRTTLNLVHAGKDLGDQQRVPFVNSCSMNFLG